ADFDVGEEVGQHALGAHRNVLGQKERAVFARRGDAPAHLGAGRQQLGADIDEPHVVGDGLVVLDGAVERELARHIHAAAAPAAGIARIVLGLVVGRVVARIAGVVAGIIRVVAGIVGIVARVIGTR